MEIEKVKVFLDRQNKWFDCEIKQFDVKKNDRVIVESSRGLEAGKVISDIENGFSNEQMLSLVRLETERDVKTIKENQIKEEEIKTKTKDIVKQLSLDMKISDVQLSLDSSKVVISFTAEDRVDFRDMVRELASSLKMRIELRQIGLRDEVKLIGAMGPCGRPCCCSNYFNDFSHVSIKMAKVQNLSLNPNNISGVCGRLMCCLAYENQYYNEVVSMMPKINSFVKTPDGQGVVAYNNLLKKLVDVKFDKDGVTEVKTYKIEDIKFEQTMKKEEVNDD